MFVQIDLHGILKCVLKGNYTLWRVWSTEMSNKERGTVSLWWHFPRLARVIEGNCLKGQTVWKWGVCELLPFPRWRVYVKFLFISTSATFKLHHPGSTQLLSATRKGWFQISSAATWKPSHVVLLKYPMTSIHLPKRRGWLPRFRKHVYAYKEEAQIGSDFNSKHRQEKSKI